VQDQKARQQCGKRAMHVGAMEGALALAAAMAAAGSRPLAGSTRVRLLSEVVLALDEGAHHDDLPALLRCLRCRLQPAWEHLSSSGFTVYQKC
jgi:hypothetical protein